MTIKVVTSEGVTYAPSDPKKELTEKSAETICAAANRRAEQLGIKTRYEVNAS